MKTFKDLKSEIEELDRATAIALREKLIDGPLNRVINKINSLNEEKKPSICGVWDMDGKVIPIEERKNYK